MNIYLVSPGSTPTPILFSSPNPLFCLSFSSCRFPTSRPRAPPEGVCSHGPSGLPSSGGGKGNGVAIAGANPWYSGDGSDGSNTTSNSERTVTAEFGIIVHPGGYGDQEVDSRTANHHEADSETDSERTEGASFGKIVNSFSNSRHFSYVDSELLPGKRQKNLVFQPDILTMVIYFQRILSGDNSYGANLV
uniref:Uncharacterized protein n=1 Tax=Oryza rufipogon TaxID=4529 RepID=A0A0E0QP77_ORYRU